MTNSFTFLYFFSFAATPNAVTTIPLGSPIDRFSMSTFQIVCNALTPLDSVLVTAVQWVRSDDMSIVSFDPASPVRQISTSNSSGHVVTLIFDRFTDEQAGAYLCVSSNNGGNFTSMTDIRILRKFPREAISILTVLNLFIHLHQRWRPAFWLFEVRRTAA